MPAGRPAGADRVRRLAGGRRRPGRDAPVRRDPRPAAVGGQREGSHTGYFPGGVFEYSKTFDVPQDYRDKSVSSSSKASTAMRWSTSTATSPAQRPNGYSGLHDRGRPVPALRRSQHDPRRCPRARGLPLVHRRGHLPRHPAASSATSSTSRSTGVRITTPDIDAERAVVAVADDRARTTVAHTRTVAVVTRIRDPDGAQVAERLAPSRCCRARARSSGSGSTCRTPSLWSVDTPTLYAATDRGRRGNEVLDEDRSTLRHPDAAARSRSTGCGSTASRQAARRVHPPRQRAPRRGDHRAAPRSDASSC